MERVDGSGRICEAQLNRGILRYAGLTLGASTHWSGGLTCKLSATLGAPDVRALLEVSAIAAVCFGLAAALIAAKLTVTGLCFWYLCSQHRFRRVPWHSPNSRCPMDGRCHLGADVGNSAGSGALVQDRRRPWGRPGPDQACSDGRHHCYRKFFRPGDTQYCSRHNSGLEANAARPQLATGVGERDD